jgi:hypothetical protein
MGKRWIAIVLGLSLLFAGSVGAQGGTPRVVDPIDPANFTSPVDNTYFPLEVGQVSVLRGQEDGERFFERVTVTDRTRVIQGVTTTVVRDLLWENGRLAERTRDWYAGDNDGNVWYFGEATATIDRHGNVIDTHGSWEAGVDGAVAGIIMPAHPRPTDAYRQEFYRGEAEDQGWIVQRNAERTVPYGHLKNLVRSFEWSRLEPRVVVQKFFAPGLGLAYERVVAGGVESLELVRFSEGAS